MLLIYPYPHLWITWPVPVPFRKVAGTQTLVKGTGIWWVRVRVGVKIPMGYPCPTLFLATIWGVSMLTTNQTWLSKNQGTWKAHFSSEYVVFLFCISYLVFSQVYKSIFTSPSSAKNLIDEENNTENVAPTKAQKISSNNSVHRNVVSKLHLTNILAISSRRRRKDGTQKLPD